MPTATTNIVSLGNAADELRVSCQRVIAVAKAAGVAPVLTVDHVPHYDANDLPKMAKHLDNREGR